MTLEASILSQNQTTEFTKTFFLRHLNLLMLMAY